MNEYNGSVRIFLKKYILDIYAILIYISMLFFENKSNYTSCNSNINDFYISDSLTLYFVFEEEMSSDEIEKKNFNKNFIYHPISAKMYQEYRG